MNIQELAQEAKSYFITDTRDNGEKFIKTKDDRPEWLHNLIFKAHDKMLPDDYKYAFVKEALDYIVENEDHECPEIEADIYTSELTAWLNSNNTRVYYLTDALEEYECKDGFAALQTAQVKEKEEVYYIVLNELREIIENQEEEETEED